MTTQQSRVHKKMVALARSRKPVIEVRNKNHVVSVNSSGRIVAEAKRHHELEDWQISALVNTQSHILQMRYVVKVSHELNEVTQRKAVLALLEVLVEDREYEDQFREEIESVPSGWIRQLSRFRGGPEIPVEWDETL